jgi:hypothetical protein
VGQQLPGQMYWLRQPVPLTGYQAQLGPAAACAFDAANIQSVMWLYPRLRWQAADSALSQFCLQWRIAVQHSRFSRLMFMSLLSVAGQSRACNAESGF